MLCLAGGFWLLLMGRWGRGDSFTKSRPWMEEKTAKHTSQFAPMPRRKIWCQCGFTAFWVASFMAADLYLFLVVCSVSCEAEGD